MTRTATMTPSDLVPGKFNYSVQEQDGSNCCFGGPVDELTVRNNVRALGVYTLAGDPDYTKLTTEELAAAFTANGYLTPSDEIRNARFVKMTESGAMYHFEFDAELHEEETGTAYVTYHTQDGFRAEF